MEKQDVKSIFSLDGTRKFIAFLSQFFKKEKTVYNLKSVKIPRTSGRTLKILAFLMRTPGTRSLLIPVLLRQAGIQSLRKCKVEYEPLMHPVHPVDKKSLLQSQKNPSNSSLIHLRKKRSQTLQ